MVNYLTPDPTGVGLMMRITNLRVIAQSDQGSSLVKYVPRSTEVCTRINLTPDLATSLQTVSSTNNKVRAQVIYILSNPITFVKLVRV